MKEINSRWFIYIVKCKDGSLYTGSTTDLQRRVETHNTGKGAKYTRSHAPVKLVYSERLLDRSAAFKREAAIKKLPRDQKMLLIATYSA